MARRAVAPCVGEGLVTRRIVLRARDVVYFKGVIEASDGLALVFAEQGGDLTVAAPSDREVELDRVLAELLTELDGLRVVVGGELPAK